MISNYISTSLPFPPWRRLNGQLFKDWSWNLYVSLLGVLWVPALLQPIIVNYLPVVSKLQSCSVISGAVRWHKTGFQISKSSNHSVVLCSCHILSKGHKTYSLTCYLPRRTPSKHTILSSFCILPHVHSNVSGAVRWHKTTFQRFLQH